jgi:hypothetical protein
MGNHFTNENSENFQNEPYNMTVAKGSVLLTICLILANISCFLIILKYTKKIPRGADFLLRKSIIRKEKTQPQFVKIENQDANKLVDDTNESCSNQEKLYHAINKLSAFDKAIIFLYLDEFSYKEISEIVGISEVNAGVKINRIKSLILKSFENGNN